MEAGKSFFELVANRARGQHFGIYDYWNFAPKIRRRIESRGLLLI